jgi:glycerophosphoryl diester phosphodiesterase
VSFARASGHPLVIGHRGAPVHAPENTIESFEAAVAAGADAIEVDVAAGLVVAHSQHEVPERALALGDALAFAKEHDIGVLLDLKHPGIEDAVAASVRRHALGGSTFVSSTSPRALRRLAAVEPTLTRSISYPNDRYRVSRFSWPRVIVTGSAATARSAMPLRVPLLLAAGRASVLTLHHALISRAVVDAARRRGAAVVAWTVNDPIRICAMARLGVDGIVTDDPGKAREVLATLNPL